MKKLFSIILISFLLASCKKDHVCECIFTDNHNGSKTATKFIFKDTKSNAKRDCEFANSFYGPKYNGVSDETVTCELK